MVPLTRSMSAATSATSASIEASEGVSKGTITATPVSTFAILAPVPVRLHRNGGGGCLFWALSWRTGVRVAGKRSRFPTIETAAGRGKAGKTVDNVDVSSCLVGSWRSEIAGTGSHQRHRAGFGRRRAARWRQYPPPGAGSEHERDRGVARHPPATNPGP